jgi:hypothetical protein
MARINQKFIESYLYNKLMEAVKPLNQVSDALDSSEKELKAEIKGIVEQITRIEI